MADHSQIIDLTLESGSESDEVAIINDPCVSSTATPYVTAADERQRLRPDEHTGADSADLSHILDIDLGPAPKYGVRRPQDEPDELEKLWKERLARVNKGIKAYKVTSFQHDRTSERRELIYGYGDKSISASLSASSVHYITRSCTAASFIRSTE
ncbi:uncharacterized protein EI90DRAFT_1024686 [Cantharellus anzutake]|uniref:uncharacterized protein n=1 Tax=Cantharellus anzutake TaxID=1750568 RepID=UPI00190497DF|nr:uncharacterized protein EI90DRAFT_1024686 [Cantharellus anzutake]KAF8331473.1 hypothetical protein EI90DRAFT_1024686 [Cantharellus anzutake]